MLPTVKSTYVPPAQGVIAVIETAAVPSFTVNTVADTFSVFAELPHTPSVNVTLMVLAPVNCALLIKLGSGSDVGAAGSAASPRTV